MKNLLYLLPLLLFCSYGCRSNYEYDKLEKIPQYPQPARSFDTSATIEFTPDADESLNKALLEAFKANGYNNIVIDTRFKNPEVGRSKVVTLLSLSNKTLYCEKDNYLETHLIILVRSPGFVWKDQLLYAPPRYFQAYSQTPLRGDYVLEKISKDELKKVLKNLFTIEEFREALEPSAGVSVPVKQNTAIPDGNKCWAVSKHIQKSANADLHEAVKWAVWACEQGNNEAADYLIQNGFLYDFIGDSQQYVKLLKMLAERGHALGQVRYGQLFFKGILIPRDDKAALYWVKKSADQQCPAGLYNLGFYYEEGIGVLPDRSKAISLYRKAAVKGHKKATEQLEDWGISLK